jgi:POT family proton-dependent oligopeptide transporter
MVGPVVCGALAEAYGWHAGFGAAAAFMAVGLVTYIAGFRSVPECPPTRGGGPATSISRRDYKTIFALAAVVAITVFQTAAYDQSANVGLVWISQHVSLATPIGRLPEAWFPSIDALSGVLFAPALLSLWRWQEARGREPSPLRKIALGALIAAGSSLAFAAGAFQSISGQASLIWPLIAFIGFGVGYMHYWPTCLALVSRAAPVRVKGTLMSLSFLGFFVGNLAMGWFGTTYEHLGPIAFWVCNAAIAFTGFTLASVFGPRLERALAPNLSPP